MALKDVWVNKRDGIDDIDANDINGIAQAVIEIEKEKETQDENDKKPAWFVTPQMYGAVGDGTTDDTNAFKQAIINANAKVFVPAGTYLITDTITIDKQVIFEGMGCEQTIIKYIGSDYLFRVSTNAKNRAIIRNINFLGTTSNSLLYCGLGGWGASFKMENCFIRLFNSVVFDLVSAFGVSVFDTRIISKGVVRTRPYDDIKPFGDTLNNVNYFEGVYWTARLEATEDDYSNVMFDLNDALYFSFRSCAFEATKTIFSLTNHSREIVLNECNVEQVNNIYKCDSTSEAPKFINIKATYAVGKFNESSTTLDYMVQSNEQTAGVYVRSGTDTMGALFENTPISFYKKIAVNNNAENPYATIYDLSTHGFNTLVPVNLKRIVFTDSYSAEYDLSLCTDGFDVGAVYDIDAIIEYSDGSYRWITASIYGKSLSNMIISNTMIKKISADVTYANKDNGVFTMDGTNLKYQGDYGFEQLTLFIRHNVIGQAN